MRVITTPNPVPITTNTLGSAASGVGYILGRVTSGTLLLQVYVPNVPGDVTLAALPVDTVTLERIN